MYFVLFCRGKLDRRTDPELCKLNQSDRQLTRILDRSIRNSITHANIVFSNIRGMKIFTSEIEILQNVCKCKGNALHNKIINCYVTLFYVALRCYAMSHDVTARNITQCHVTSQRVASLHVKTRRDTSWYITPYQAIVTK